MADTKTPTEPRRPLYEAYECAYPDAKRRASGEPPDEAISRVRFATWGEAESFCRRNGGTISTVLVSELERRRMRPSHSFSLTHHSYRSRRRGHH